MLIFYIGAYGRPRIWSRDNNFLYNSQGFNQMTEHLFNWYKQTKGLIQKAMTSDSPGASTRHMVEEWVVTAKFIENSFPDIEKKYSDWVKMVESFTDEQKDFICYQIGDWYIEWKDRLIIDLKHGQHRLGFAKEQLKTSICGE